ncbi:MAG: hypothetical protein FJY86_00050 [Candidatus Diapherotrites archaeon]|uniref:RecF/RecN/SMC N-terminal domain-containing protein n=1 Tax=Candidatus Iainarchaeum sp. TaxID=3101447 RepID=A0A8T4C995_9ARCH|nr:hypothetical protein [Candidatus Diapherotrites archaeon]
MSEITELTLTKLRLKNFKSFKNVTIPFTKGFTAIAGANGSGKSNIMDAVLFALGETSLKSIRAARLTDLVFSGAPAGENYAVVNLTLQGKENSYELSRTIDKQGKSVYRLNEKRVTLGEIQNLLHELGLRVDGHNLVSQGDLMRIIDMNPIERRELIDEVAGLQEFEEKKNEALKDLEKVDRKVKDVTIVLNERMAIIEQLGKERDIASKFKKLEKELRETKATILHTEAHELNVKLEGLVTRQVELIGKKEEAITKQKDAQQAIQEMEKEFTELDQKVLGVKSHAYESVGKSVEENKSEIRITEERIHHASQKLEELTHTRKEIEHITTHAKEGIVKVDEESKQLQSQFAEIEGKISPLRQKQADSLKKKVELLNESQKIEKDVQFARDTVTHTREKIAHIHAKVENIRRSNELTQLMRERLEKQIVNVKREISLLKNDVEELEKLQKKYPHVEKARVKISQEMKEVEHHVAEHHGHVFAHTESLTQLGKTKSHCPICERELKEEHKKELAKQKKEAIEEARLHAKKWEEEKKKLHEEWDALHRAETLMKRLAVSEEKMSEYAKQEKILITELEKARVSEKDEGSVSLIGERKKLEEKLVEEKKTLDVLEVKLNKLRDALNQTTMDQTLNSLNEEKSRIEKQLFQYQTQKSVHDNALVQASSRMKHVKEEEKHTEETRKQEEKKREELIKKLAQVEQEYDRMLHANQALLQKRDRVGQKITSEREKERAWQEKAFRIEGQVNEIKIDQSKYDTRLTDVNEELKNFEGVKTLEKNDTLELKKRIPVIEHEIRQLGTVNMKALEDFSQYEKDVLDIKQKSQTLDVERLAVLDLINSIDAKRNETFMGTFDKISENFNKIYTGFFDGTAKLELTDPAKPLESGLLIEAKHGLEKSLKNIDSMSGGEKSLTSLAFIFAIQLYEPAPFYFFDEVDAALDMNNSRKIGALIREMSKSSQFISITHNDSIVKVADRIVGVAKSSNNSSVIGLRAAPEIVTE